MIIMPSVTVLSLFMERVQFDQIIEHLDSVWPEEGCGLIAGKAGIAKRVFAIPNILHSHTRFRMDPAQQVHAMHAILDEGMDLLGIYHSHPEGPSRMSKADIQEITYPQAASLVFWREGGSWKARAFGMVDGRPAELELIVS